MFERWETEADLKAHFDDRWYKDMREHLGVDSLKFISLNGLYRAVGEAKGRDAAKPQYCDACFSGDYPVEPADQIDKGFTLKAAE